MLISLRSFTHVSGARLMLMPSASRQSAAPDFDEAARLPCFATLMPAAAMRNAAVVEMLMLPAWSPPVPTISRTSISCSTLSAWSRMAAAEPEISSMVSAFALFVESAAR